jgi:hypothetical protein
LCVQGFVTSCTSEVFCETSASGQFCNLCIIISIWFRKGAVEVYFFIIGTNNGVVCELFTFSIIFWFCSPVICSSVCLFCLWKLLLVNSTYWEFEHHIKVELSKSSLYHQRVLVVFRTLPPLCSFPQILQVCYYLMIPSIQKYLIQPNI